MAYQNKALKRKILRDKYNAIIFKSQKGNMRLVGGYIRDLLIGVYSRDRDYIVNENFYSSVSDIKKKVGGKAIQFKKGNMIRVAVKKETTLDFSEMQGSLYQDLSGRDFTINALAWSPEEGIIDYFHGLQDLDKRIVRAISKENILSDPLRMLRAYRFAADLNGKMEVKTRKIVKIFNHRIKDISSERITLEMFHLLNSEHAAKYLHMAIEDGLLTHILTLNHKELHCNIESIAKTEKGILDVLPGKIKVRLKKLFSQNLTYKGLLCLEILIKSGRSTDNINNLLRLSSKIRKRVQFVLEVLDNFSQKKPDLFNIFMVAQEGSIDALIISQRTDLLREYYRFRKIWKGGFLTSEEIKEISGVDEGEKLGDIILKIKREQFERKIRNKTEALKYLKSMSAI